MMQMLFFIVSLLASIAGAICGIGGGVVIKPTLDMFHLASVSTISFLSGCTVLSMSCYSVVKGMLAHDSQVDVKTGTPLAIGAAQNSLYIILFSQITNLLTTLLKGTVPEFELMTLVLMVAGGIGGGMIGRLLNRRMNNRAVDRLFLCLMVLIMGISLYNTWRYAAL